MSHELRTPLNAVLGFGQLLSLRELEPDARVEVERILKAGDHLLELINETLDIAHIESGRLTLAVKPVELAPVIDDVVGLMAPLSADRKTTIVVDAESLGGWVTADAQRLKQVLLNVLSNAVKFNKYEGLVEVAGVPAPDGWVAVAVTDTGIGIDPGDMPRLFSPFERLRTVDVDGSGLGLALSRGLMEAMDGRLTATSELGLGSTFTIELPAAEPVSAKAAEALSPVARVAPDEDSVVLYIEDNRSNRELMERVFGAADDLHLLLAEDGLSGIEAACEHNPQLVLLDMNLPDIDGDEVLDRLRADDATKAIPVIVVSADATRATINAMLERGAAAYVTKPIDVTVLFDTIDAALAGVHAH